MLPGPAECRAGFSCWSIPPVWTIKVQSPLRPALGGFDESVAQAVQPRHLAVPVQEPCHPAGDRLVSRKRVWAQIAPTVAVHQDRHLVLVREGREGHVPVFMMPEEDKLQPLGPVSVV